jgi:hypothetical protein
MVSRVMERARWTTARSSDGASRMAPMKRLIAASSKSGERSSRPDHVAAALDLAV